VRVAAERGELAKRRDVAVHAEDSVGRDDRGRVGARFELSSRAVDIGVRVTLQGAAGELRGVDQRSVVELVLYAEVVAIEQRRDRAEVRGPAVREEQRALA